MDERVEGEDKRRVPEGKLKLVQNLLKVGAKNVRENFLHAVSIGVNLRGQKTVCFFCLFSSIAFLYQTPL